MVAECSKRVATHARVVGGCVVSGDEELQAVKVAELVALCDEEIARQWQWEQDRQAAREECCVCGLRAGLGAEAKGLEWESAEEQWPYPRRCPEGRRTACRRRDRHGLDDGKGGGGWWGW